ncbi:Hypp1935 [Branchiostoma lanceolatum]|uniref:Hypp1935 protein n=1 Tax=Branchiostoma lanceolatum TaxID=7740 RepID=A0A8K0EKY1_BRALA|nr:Hypp1935 [Branchiostoma lanceolatum]
MSGVGNAVYSALSAVNADCDGDQQDKEEPTTMLDLDTHTLTTTDGMVLRSGQSISADQSIGPTDTEDLNPCDQHTENSGQISNTSDGSKDSKDESENDCPKLDLQVGIMTRARARRLQQLLVLEEATSSAETSTVSAPVTTHDTNSHQPARMEEMNAAQPAISPGSMDAVAMAMMCSGLEEDTPEDVASRNNVVHQGTGLNIRDEEGNATCQVIHCIPGANVTQTINRAHPELLPTIITSMSTLAGHHVTSLTIQGQEFYFLEEVAYAVYNHTVSYVLNRCNCLQISRIRCRGEYLEFLRPYCRFIDRRSNHCYLIRGEDAEQLYHSFQKIKKITQKTVRKKRVFAKCAHCGQENSVGRKQGRKRKAEATVSVNPENYPTDRLQEDAVAANMLQSGLGPDNLFPRGSVTSFVHNPALIGSYRDATCQTDGCSTEEAGENLEGESGSPPKKRHCDGVVSTACQTINESKQSEIAEEQCSSMEQHSRRLGTAGETSRLPAEELRRSPRRRHESRSSMVTSTSQSINLPTESTNPEEQEMTTFYITTKVVGTRLQKVDFSVCNDKGEELACNIIENRDSEDQGYSETVEETPVSPVEGLGNGEESEFSNEVAKARKVEDSGVSLAEEFCCEEDQAEGMIEGCTADHDSGISMKEVDSLDEHNSSPESDISPPDTCMDKNEDTKTSYVVMKDFESLAKERARHDMMGEDEEDMEEVLSIMQESGISVADKNKEDLYSAKEETMQETCLEDVMMMEEHHIEDEVDLGEVVSIMQESGIEVADGWEIPYESEEESLQDVCEENVMEEGTSQEDMEDVMSIMEDSGISLADDVMSKNCKSPKIDKRGTAVVENAEDTAILDQNKNEVLPLEKSLTLVDITTVGEEDEGQTAQEEVMSMAVCKDDRCPNLAADFSVSEEKTGMVEEKTAEMLCTPRNGPDHIEHTASEVDKAMPSLYPIQEIMKGKLSYSDTESKKASSSTGEELLDPDVEEENQTMECIPCSLNRSLHFQKEDDKKLCSEGSGPAHLSTNNSPQPCILPDNCVTSKKSTSDVTQNCTVHLWHCSPLLVSHTSKGGAFANWGYLYPHWCATPQDSYIYCPVCNAFFSVSVYLGHFHEKRGMIVHRSSYGLQLESRQATGEQKRLWTDFTKKHPAAIKGCATPQKRQTLAAKHNAERCKRKIAVRFKKVRGGTWTVSSSSKECVGKDDTTKVKAVGAEKQNDKALVEKVSCGTNQCATDSPAAGAENQQTASSSTRKSAAENIAADAKEQQISTYCRNKCVTENTAAVAVEEQVVSCSTNNYTAENTAAAVDEEQTASYSTMKSAAEDIVADTEEQETPSYSTRKSAAEDIAANAEEQETPSYSIQKSAAEDIVADTEEQETPSYSPRKSTAEDIAANAEEQQTPSCSTGKAAEESTPDVANHNIGITEPIGSLSNPSQSSERFSSPLKGTPRGRRTGGKPGGDEKKNPKKIKPSNRKNLSTLEEKSRRKGTRDQPRGSETSNLKKTNNHQGDHQVAAE